MRLGRRCVVMRSTPNKRMNTDPQQQCCAPLLWAGYAQRWTSSVTARVTIVGFNGECCESR